ncbi:hypothetical protein V2G26_017518 [Clonostachys chloroleuca]
MRKPFLPGLRHSDAFLLSQLLQLSIVLVKRNWIPFSPSQIHGQSQRNASLVKHECRDQHFGKQHPRPSTADGESTTSKFDTVPPLANPRRIVGCTRQFRNMDSALLAH